MKKNKKDLESSTANITRCIKSYKCKFSDCDFPQNSVYYRYFPEGVEISLPDGTIVETCNLLFNKDGFFLVCADNYADIKKACEENDLIEQTIH